MLLQSELHSWQGQLQYARLSLWYEQYAACRQPQQQQQQQ
jgi:hypothetical protein